MVHYSTVYTPDPEQGNTIVATPVFDYRGVFGELDAYSKGAISTGLYNTNPSYRVPVYQCGIANCTWADYPSLAIGVHCADLTPQLTSREAIYYTNYTNPLAVIQIIAAFANEYVNSSAEVTALECVMFPAVKTYFSAVGSWYTDSWWAAQSGSEDLAVGPLDTPDAYFESMVDMYEEYTYVAAENNSINAGYFLIASQFW